MQIAPEPSSPSPAPTIVIDPNSLVNDISSSNAGSSAPTSPAGYDLSATSMGALSSSPTSPTSPKPHLKRDIDGSIARAITKHAEAKARNAKKKFGKNTAGTTAGTRGEPKKTQTHHDEAFYNRPWTRAYYGTLLSVVEKSGGGSKNLQIRRIQYWLPIAEMLIQFVQLSAINDFIIPTFTPGWLAAAVYLKQILLLNFTTLSFKYLKGFELGTFTFALATVAVILLVTLLVLMGYLFAVRRTSKRFVMAVSAYIALITGLGFMPCFDNLERVMVKGFSSGSPRQLIEAIVCLICLLYLVGFTLMIGQNAFPNDPNSFNLMKRRHNRMDLMSIVIKIVLLVGAEATDTVQHGLNLGMFSLMFLLHFFTYSFYVPLANRCYNAYYICLMYGAACRFAITLAAHPETQRNIEIAYWAALAFLLLFALGISVPSLDMARVKINELVISKFSFFDLADNSELIYNFDLSALLKSATRMGNYAQFLLEHKATELANNFFLKALKEDPLHADNLGRYGDLLMQQGRHEEAQDYYRSALKADPENRENLERYASFLASHDMDDALFYYQRSVLGYIEHWNYRELYSQSSDAMFIVDLEGNVQDCNGAALHLFKSNGRTSLCADHTIFDLVAIDSVDSFRKSIDRLISEGLPNHRFESRITTMRGKTLSVNVVVTRMKHGGSIVLHISMVDVTDLKRLLETNALIFEKSLSPMVMINTSGIVLQYNECAVQAFGYSKEEVLMHNVNILMPPEIASIHDSLIERYLTTGVKRVVGAVRDIPVRTKQGEIRTCSLRLNELRVGTDRFFIAILMDVTDLKAAIEKSAALFEKGLSPMLVINTKGVIQNYNEEAEKTFGYKKDEVIGQKIEMLMPPEIAVQHDGYLQRYLDTGERHIVGTAREVPVITKDGERLNCVLRVNELGQSTYIGIFFDITESKRASELSDAMFEMASSPMILLDRHCIVRRFNAYAEETFGYVKEEVVGQNIKMLMKPEVGLLHDGYISRYMATKQAHVIGSTREVEAVSKQGQVFKVGLRVNEIELDGTSFFIGIMIIMDKEKRKSVEAAVSRRSPKSTGTTPRKPGSDSRRGSFDFLKPMTATIGEEDEDSDSSDTDKKASSGGCVFSGGSTLNRLEKAVKALHEEQSGGSSGQSMLRTGGISEEDDALEEGRAPGCPVHTMRLGTTQPLAESGDLGKPASGGCVFMGALSSNHPNHPSQAWGAQGNGRGSSEKADSGDGMV